MSRLALHRYCESVMGLARVGNKYFDSNAPWKLAKTDMARLRVVLAAMAELVRRMTIMIAPVVPHASETILSTFGVPDSLRTFRSIDHMAYVSAGYTILKPSPVFPRLQVAGIENHVKK